MADVWPVSLPAIPLVDNYSEKFGTNTIRTPMDHGPAKRRPRYTTTHDPTSFMFELDGAQLDIFKAFYITTLRHGERPFELTHPTELTTATFAFLDEPEMVPVDGGSYRVTFSAERIG
jgi:hypothetical protein